MGQPPTFMKSHINLSGMKPVSLCVPLPKTPEPLGGIPLYGKLGFALVRDPLCHMKHFGEGLFIGRHHGCRRGDGKRLIEANDFVDKENIVCPELLGNPLRIGTLLLSLIEILFRHQRMDG